MSAKRAPTNRLRFTIEKIDSLPLPEKGQRATYHDTKVPGLLLRVTANGTKSFYVFQRVNGKPERVRVGRHPYPTMSIEQARREAKSIIHQIAEGESPAAAKREEKVAALTLAEAFADYIARKQRKDDKPLKERTRRDYAAMIAPGRLTAAGKRTKGGTLAKLASKPIFGLTGDEIRAVHGENLKTRGERQSHFAMMTLKAVLRWHGVVIPDSPFDERTPEARRIIIKKPGVSPREPITALRENLGVFWQALPDTPAGDYLRFLALTGCRPGEPLKIRVGDLKTGAITLIDTKNRSNHTLYLSTQALEVVQRQAEGKQPADRLFDVTPAQANALAHELRGQLGIQLVPKLCRAVFASTAERLCTAGVAKVLLNHKNKADIFGTNYDTKLEVELRAGWQAVADYISAA